MAPPTLLFACQKSVGVCVRVCVSASASVYVYMDICTYVYKCMYVYIYTCCIRVCMYSYVFYNANLVVGPHGATALLLACQKGECVCACARVCMYI